MELDDSKTVCNSELGGESSEETPLCSVDINTHEEDIEYTGKSNPIIDDHFLQVPSMLGVYLPGFHASSSVIKDEGGKRARHKRSHSVHHVKTSGESTPTRKFSVTSVDRHKPTLNSISRISALSSNFLNASFSNIHRCSSAKNLFSFFSHSQRGVRDQHKELLRESEYI